MRDDATMPSEQERETDFLKRCIRYDESAAGRQLFEQLAQVQHDERCLRRASWLISLVAALAIAGLGYGAVLLKEFPGHLSAFVSLFVIKIMSALGIGSLICLVAFTGTGFVYRRELSRRRQECRVLVTKLLESRLVLPAPASTPDAAREREKVLAASATKIEITAPEPNPSWVQPVKMDPLNQRN